MVSGLTTPTTIAASSSKTFVVTFTPSAAGTRTATITVNSDDADEAVYDFAVQGAREEYTFSGGTWSPALPLNNSGEIDVPAGTELVIKSGDTYTIPTGTVFKTASPITVEAGATLINNGEIKGGRNRIRNLQLARNGQRQAHR